jgi:hypothetical protein
MRRCHMSSWRCRMNRMGICGRSLGCLSGVFEKFILGEVRREEIDLRLSWLHISSRDYLDISIK